MISMDKTYKTRDGCDVRIACVNAGSNAPVVAVVNDETVSYSANGRFFKSINHESVWDLIEVSPYADFTIDEPVMVRKFGGWVKRHFAGVTDMGSPKVWDAGFTSWTSEEQPNAFWSECRRPTAEELAS